MSSVGVESSNSFHSGPWQIHYGLPSRNSGNGSFGGRFLVAGFVYFTHGDSIHSMVFPMPKTKIKLASPAVHFGATKIPVFVETTCGRWIFQGHVIEQAAEARKAA